MMKRFFKSGKWMGLIMVGLLFAGCYGGGGSSEEGAVTTGSQTAVSSVPLTFNPGPNPTLIVGDGGLGYAVANVDGHDIEITNGLTAGSGSTVGCVGAGMDAQCWIRLINRDPSMYMANAYILGQACVGCLTAQIDNADLIFGATTGDCVGTDGDAGCGGSVAVDEVGWCIVEDGQFKLQPSPHNELGCKTHPTASGGVKPYQLLHPECGMLSYLFDFGNQLEKYTFTGTIVAEWYPWSNPLGDARYDLQDRSTYYIMVTDLENNAGVGATANGQAWMILGSHIRSNVLSGWNATGSNVLNPGQYFGVSVAVEYPDRIESQVMGNNTQNQDYEYYIQYGYLFRFNQGVVRHAQGDGTTPVGGTPVYGGAQQHCSADHAADFACNSLWEAYTGLDSISGLNSYEGTGWIALYVDLDGNFTFHGGGANFNTYGGGVIALNGNQSPTAFPSYIAAPKMNAHFGVAHINPALTNFNMYAKGSPTYIDINGVIQEGPDAEPDMPIAVYSFQVLAGTSGRGSEFWVDVMSTASGLNYYYTNGTIYPSGNEGGSDDWSSYCWPMTAGPQGCGPEAQATFDVFASLENTNLAISHSGMSAYGGDADGGAMQQWAAHICVQ